MSLDAYDVRVRYRIPTILCISVIYAALDETTQGWVRRSPEVLDWVCDVAGAVLATAIWEGTARLFGARRVNDDTAAPPTYHQFPY